jgi:hypothetical protein
VDHPGGGSKDVADAAAQAHRLALQAFMNIKGGMRYFPDFGNHNLSTWRFKDEEYSKVSVGIYFGPEAFYAVWISPESLTKEKARRRDYDAEKMSTKFTKRQVKVLREWTDHSSTTLERMKILGEMSSLFEGANITYIGDPQALIRSDINRVSPIKEFRKLGFPMRTRKRMDRSSLDPVSMLLREKDGLIVHEQECPLLIRALRKASHKVMKGVKSAALENTGEEYPLYALRVGLEDALKSTRVTSY